MLKKMGVNFGILKHSKHSSVLHRTSLYCNGNVLFLVFRDYSSVTAHTQRAVGGGKGGCAASRGSSQAVFWSLGIYIYINFFIYFY